MGCPVREVKLLVVGTVGAAQFVLDATAVGAVKEVLEAIAVGVTIFAYSSLSLPCLLIILSLALRTTPSSSWKLGRLYSGTLVRSYRPNSSTTSALVKLSTSLSIVEAVQEVLDAIAIGLLRGTPSLLKFSSLALRTVMLSFTKSGLLHSATVVISY